VSNDGTPRFSDRRPLVVSTLTAVVDLLAELADSAQTRALRSKARSFETAVRAWSTVAPSKAQIAAMLDLVLELQAKALGARGTQHTSLPPGPRDRQRGRPER